MMRDRMQKPQAKDEAPKTTGLFPRVDKEQSADWAHGGVDREGPPISGLRVNLAGVPVQRKGTVEAPPNRTGLPDRLKSGIEQLSGYAMDDVRVHYNSPKPARLQAHAYTQGANIHVAPGQEKHLPHEAWHVVQQMQGRVKPTIQMACGEAMNNDLALEREADEMGEHARRWASQPNQNNSVKQRKSMSRNHTQLAPPIQPMLKFFMNALKKYPFPGLESGSGEWAKGLQWIGYRLQHKFANYQINGSFVAKPNECSEIVINYIEKTQESRGFGHLLRAVEESAQEIGSKEVSIEWRECKKEVIDKLEKYSKEYKWELQKTGLDYKGTGPDMTMRKKIDNPFTVDKL